MEETKFKIYSLLLVKNEADIIEASLIDACRWSDKVIVIDNGSTDDTWERVQQLALSYPQIIPFMQYTGRFHIGLRAKAFRAFRDEMTRRDWWCVRLDADEFYTDDVRSFLAHVPKGCRSVSKESTDYVLTQEDITKNQFAGNFLTDRSLLTHYLPRRRRERRFVRHTPLLFWRESWRYPHPLYPTYSKPIQVAHYQYRSPEQMEKRFLTRRQAKQDGCGSFKHEQGNTWQDYLLTDKQLQEQHLLAHLPQAFEQSRKVIHAGRNTLKIIGDDIVVKRFKNPVFPNNLIYGTLRKSKARRSYEYALRLGNLTPQPICYQEIRKGGMLRESYYACRLSPLPYTLRMLEKTINFPNRKQHLRALARFTAHLHEQGILHKDYSGGNILFDEEGNIQLVDLNRLRFEKHISMRKGCKNFSRWLLNEEECEIVGIEYARERGFDSDTCIRLIKRYCSNINR